MKHALIVLVHGSPRPIANEAMFAVVEQIKARGVFDIVAVGFMECNAPDIPTAIDECIAQGASQITAVPYFLHTGTHVADDLPTLLKEAAARHPNVQFSMARYIGANPIVSDILLDRARVVQ